METTCLPRIEKLLKIERRVLRKKKTQEIYRGIKDLETEINKILREHGKNGTRETKQQSI